jgi:hypothetical protein
MMQPVLAAVDDDEHLAPCARFGHRCDEPAADGELVKPGLRR